MIEGGLPLISEEPSNLRRLEARLLEILKRKTVPQLVDDFGEIRSFFREPARHRSGADRQRLGDRFNIDLTMEQQALDLVLHRRAKRAFPGMARPSGRLAVWPQHFQQPPVFGYEWKVEDIICKLQRADRRSKLDRATVGALKLLYVSVANMRARNAAGPDVAAGNLSSGLEG